MALGLRLYSTSPIDPLLSISLQEGGVHPSVSPRVPCTPPAVGEKDKLLRRLRVRVQLPELDTLLPRRLHHVLVHQRLRLHRNELSAGQRESGLFGLQRSVSFGPPLIEASRLFSPSPSAGVCGGWRGSPSGERMGTRVRKVHLHAAAGQGHSAAHRSVCTARVRSDVSAGGAD